MKHPINPIHSKLLSFLIIIAGMGLPLKSPLAEAAAIRHPEARAELLTSKPLLDGIIHGDVAWSKVTPLQQFWQIRPKIGEPASQKTEVYIGYTNDTLYIGAVLHDSDPDNIIVADSRRDTDLKETDSFTLIIDSFLDQQNGFVFGTNPAGIEYDGQVTNEGSGNFGSGGGGFNLNWDTNWSVKTKKGDYGWSLEMAIPFTSLRYGKGAIQKWGFNFQRNIRRINETSYWAALDRQYNIYRVSEAGTIDNIRVPVQRNLKITPYGLAKTIGGNNIPSDSTKEFGMDVKYSVTPSLTLDLTYNTDFAQVENDEFQINLDRFSLFLPEQRPFFLENAGQFAVGAPKEVELFFSRRIGISANGQQIPIQGGARLSGKVGSNTNIGLLHMSAEALPGSAPQNDFTVARVNKEFENRSSLGFLVVNRNGDGSLNADPSSDYNRTYAVDGRLGLGQYADISGFYAKTQSPHLKGKDNAFLFRTDYNSQKWSYRGAVSHVGSNFNPEVGFLKRKGFDKADIFVLRRIRSESWKKLYELRPHIAYFGYWGEDDFYETGYWHIDQHWEWKNGYEIHTGVNLLHEGVRESFNLVGGKVIEPGEYDEEELNLVLKTDQGAPLSLFMRTKIGGLFGGDRIQLNPRIRYRIGDTFNANLSWSYNRIDLEDSGEPFTINVGSLRMTYSFNPKISLQALIQYNDSTDVLATNFRFAWLTSADAGFYLVYNETRDDDIGQFLEKRREWILKYSKTFDLMN